MALFRHTISGTYPGESWSFTYHTEGTIPLGDAEAASAAAITGAYNNGFATITTADVVTTLSSTASIDVLTEGQISREETVLSLAGTDVGEALPAQNATAISLTTVLANRHGRGRFFLPPLAVSTVAGGKLAAAAVGNLVTAFTNFFDVLETQGLAVVVRDRTNHVSTTVTAARVGDVIDTQRRRRNKLVETYSAIPV